MADFVPYDGPVVQAKPPVAGGFVPYDGPVVTAPKPIGAAMSINNPPPSIGPGPRTSEMPDQPTSQSWGDVAGRAASNFLPSLGNAAENVYNAFRHPIDTGEGLVKLGVGALENLPQPRMTDDRKNAIAAANPEMVKARAESAAGAGAVGDFYKNRYGGLENIKETIASDPAGVMMDASGVLPATDAVLPGRVASVVRNVDPLTAAGNVLKGAGKATDVVGSNALGLTTGAGTDAIRTAGRAGRESGRDSVGAPRPVPATDAGPAPGMVRMYHGGENATSGGDRHVTSNLDYAKNWRPGNPVWYVDVPESSPWLVDSVDVSGTNMPRVIGNSIAPPEVMAGAKRLGQPETNATRASGRENASAFWANMTGKVPIKEVVAKAKDAVASMRQEASDAYKAGKADLQKDVQVIPFDDINAAVDKAESVGKFRGQSGTAPPVTMEPVAAETVDKMKGLIQAWQLLDPAEYHTPVGIDALKRALGNIRDSTGPHTPERTAAARIYKAVRDQVAEKAPGYSDMMEGWGSAQEAIKEAERTFSLTERATGDTGARKLASAMRNNVQTNFGERGRLLNVLAEHEPTLPYSIAGQSLNSLAPRGLSRVTAPVIAGGTMATNPASALAYLAASSPRIVGTLVYAGGKVIGTVEDVASSIGVTPESIRALEQGGFQGGRNNALAQ